MTRASRLLQPRRAQKAPTIAAKRPAQVVCVGGTMCVNSGTAGIYAVHSAKPRGVAEALWRLHRVCAHRCLQLLRPGCSSMELSRASCCTGGTLYSRVWPLYCWRYSPRTRQHCAGAVQVTLPRGCAPALSCRPCTCPFVTLNLSATCCTGTSPIRSAQQRDHVGKRQCRSIKLRIPSTLSPTTYISRPGQ